MKVKIGIIGIGNIFPAYVRGCRAFDILEIVACADIDGEKAKQKAEVPLTHSTDVGRGIGVADMAYATVHGRPQRASGEMAYQVLDAMEAFEDASQTGRHVEIASRCSKPALLPLGLERGKLDA